VRNFNEHTRGLSLSAVNCDPELALRCEWTSGEEWKRSLSANLRKKTAKALRQMSEHGEVVFHVYEGDDPPMDVVEAMVRHRTTWSQTHGMRGMFDQPNVDDFFVDLASGTARRAQLALASITCGDALVSQHMMLKYKTTIYSYVLGTDPAWNKYSPGNLAHIHAICWAIDNGYQVFDHLQGDFPYKHKFTNLHRTCEEFCFHRSAKGRIGREFFIARRALLRFVHNHRQRFVRAVPPESPLRSAM
jgi:CelD/BcsL family acetyltransferase involved in cellulose biosynthesis